MASFRKQVSASGTVFYQAIWNIYTNETDAEGRAVRKRKRQTKSFDKQGDAKAFARKMELEVENAGLDDRNLHTFANYVKSYLERSEVAGDIAYNTVRAHRTHLAMLVREIGHLEMGKVSPSHVEDAMIALKVKGQSAPPNTKDPERKQRFKPYAPQTLNHAFRVGNMIMEHAVNKSVITHNPFHRCKAPTVPKRKVVIFSEDQGLAVWRRAVVAHETGKHPGIDVAVAILFTCGMRSCELVGLAFDAIDLDNCTMKLHRSVVLDKDGNALLREDEMKTENGFRTISFPPDLLPMIKRQRAWVNEQVMRWGRRDYQTEPLLVFPDFGGLPMQPGTLGKRMKKLQTEAGVKGVAPTHGFRHTMASKMVADGIDIKTVSDRLGHADVAFTMRTYVQTVEGQDAAAAKHIGEQFGRMRKAAESQ